MKMEFKTLYYLEENDIAYIMINMPPANKMIPEFLDEIVTVINDYALQTTAKGIVVSGEGRHFSSGADVDLLVQHVKENSVRTETNEIIVPERNLNVKRAFHRLYQSKIPVIAVVNGFCIGSGFELALHTHLRIAEKGARVGLPEMTFGLIPGVNGTIRCIEKIGYKKAIEFIFKGELVPTDEAFNMNLVDYITKKNTGMELTADFIHYMSEHLIECTEQSVKEMFLLYIEEKREA